MAKPSASLRPISRDRNPAPVQLTLLGSFGLVCEGEPISLPMSAQRLLAFVALHDHPLQRLYAAGSLWLDSSEKRAAASLRSALWRVNRHSRDLLEAVGEHIALRRGLEVDLRRSETLALNALEGADAEALRIDISELGADLLPDWYEEWVLLPRERFRQLRLHALDALCMRLMRANRLPEALEVGLTSVAGEPLRESAHRAIIRIHLAEGNANEALRQYRLCRQLLREQLGVEPSEQLKALVKDL